MTVTLRTDEALVLIGGELDAFTTFDLSSLLNAVIDRGHTSLVLDLAGVGYVDAAGLRVIAAATQRVVAGSGQVVLRTPPFALLPLLETKEPQGHITIENVRAAAAGRSTGFGPVHLGPEQPSGADFHGSPADGGTQRDRALVGAEADEVVDGVLRLVVALARATVEGADGVSVSLRREGKLATVAATDETISAMDARQYESGEGPCVDASVKGRWFHAESLANERRWPVFTPKARALGINAILSSPLLAAATPIGALNIYSRTAESFAAPGQELASLFAKEASNILTSAGLGPTSATPN